MGFGLFCGCWLLEEHEDLVEWVDEGEFALWTGFGFTELSPFLVYLCELVISVIRVRWWFGCIAGKDELVE